MESNECWCLFITNGGALWKFSTEKLARRAIKFFNLEVEDYVLYTSSILDDEEFIRRLKWEGEDVEG